MTDIGHVMIWVALVAWVAASTTMIAAGIGWLRRSKSAAWDQHPQNGRLKDKGLFHPKTTE
ncbi:hypothetical protein GCM10027027_23580 [Neomicrococcus lactis]